AGLSDSQIKALQGGSFTVDFSVRGQTSASRAYQHGMQSPGDTPEQARIQKDIFIFEHEIAASDAAIAAGRIDNSALRELGKALHPIMDATSPAHAGRTFGGIPSIPALGPVGLLMDILEIWQHGKLEKKVTVDQFHRNIDNVRAEYLKTFGQEEF